ncbi:hypothetical protein [Candidatus Accumulibacter sp. ACC012]|jgi:hypothetical protein|uniref:hypothetical protein n=1 Tax=Candidatus Accumulibacter sp. ACC012 TaxID=2823332 RepID=UPI0025C2B2A6|nr:hypothetical protein [Candidatus Accumulibacter sp. ACC012]
MRKPACSMCKPFCSSGKPLIRARQPAECYSEALVFNGATENSPGKAPSFQGKALRYPGKEKKPFPPVFLRGAQSIEVCTARL